MNAEFYSAAARPLDAFDCYQLTAGHGSCAARVDMLKKDKQKRQHHKMRCWRNKAKRYNNSDIYNPIAPEEVREMPVRKSGFFSHITRGKSRAKPVEYKKEEP